MYIDSILSETGRVPGQVFFYVQCFYALFTGSLRFHEDSLRRKEYSVTSDSYRSNEIDRVFVALILLSVLLSSCTADAPKPSHRRRKKGTANVRKADGQFKSEYSFMTVRA